MLDERRGDSLLVGLARAPPDLASAKWDRDGELSEPRRRRINDDRTLLDWPTCPSDNQLPVKRWGALVDAQTLITVSTRSVACLLGRDMIAVHGLETAPRRGTTLVMRRSLDS